MSSFESEIARRPQDGLPVLGSRASRACILRVRWWSNGAPSPPTTPWREWRPEQFYDRLRQLFAERKQITTFGPYSPGQAVALKRMGIEGIYLGGWATSARGSVTEDPGPDLASYPLSQVPDEAAPIVRALLTADRNQRFARSRLSEAQRAASPEIDYRPFIIADADTGHGGDAHVRNLIRRFVEVGVPGYHIEDQKPGAKKCGHQGGKVLVGVDEQIKRLSAARFQLDVMKVPGLIVARTDAESATFLEGRGDERDHPFILGATNVELPTYKVGYLAILRKLHELGIDDARGHLLFKISAAEYDEASAWLERTGVMRVLEESAKAFRQADGSSVEALLDSVETQYLEAWQSEANLTSYPQAVADVIEFRASEGERFDVSAERVAGLREPDVVPRRPGQGQVDGHRHHLGLRGSPRLPRATTRYRAESSTRSPGRWLSPRSPTCCGWRPRPRTWRTPGASPRPSTPSSPPRCSRTTCHRRSTGTRPG